MNNFLLGFPNKKERDDFFIAIVVILFFISLFWFFLGRGDGPKLDSSLIPVAEVVADDLDSDMDGVLDSNDDCPNMKGDIDNNGCPMDSDKDGVYDRDDKCPELAGIKSNNGCPSDTDGDGVYDMNDDCPNIAFSSASGCPPDTDGDGIFDADDKCPKVKGSPENGGCPFSKKEEKILMDIQSSVEFETGRAALTKASLAKLDQLVVLLKGHNDINMLVEGHTDNVGDAQKNLKLSKARAAACKTYLVSKGIASGRLKSNGFGSNRPIATNDTKEGQRKNRRVEFNSY